jgi:hypothetical protein
VGPLSTSREVFNFAQTPEVPLVSVGHHRQRPLTQALVTESQLYPRLSQRECLMAQRQTENSDKWAGIQVGLGSLQFEVSQSLHDALRELVHRAEAEVSESIAGFTLVSANGLSIKEGIFPTLPTTFEESLAGIAISLPFTGSCSEAICNAKTVTCCDIANDGRFDSRWCELCLGVGIQSLQSKPICIEGQPPLGAFVLAFKQPVSRDKWDEALMGKYATLAHEAISS